MKGSISLALFLPLLRLAFAHGEDLTIRTEMLYSRPSISISSGSGVEGSGNSFAPLVRARPGVEVSYGKYGLSFSSALDEGFYGPPRLLSGGLTDARAFYYGDAWGFNGYHQYVRGFFSGDPESDEDDWAFRQGMTLRSMSATVYRAIAEDFHVYRMAEGLSETGMEPDAVFFFNLSRDHLRDDNPFVYVNGVWDSPIIGVRDLDLYTASVGGGLALSTNAGGIYFDPAMFVGVGAQYREWNGHPELDLDLVTFNLRMRMGYRTRWFDAGAGFENESRMVNGNDGEKANFTYLVARAQLQVYL